MSKCVASMFGSPEPTEILSVQNSFTNSLSAYISQNGLGYFQLNTGRYTESSYSNFLVFLLYYSFFFHKKIYSQVDLVSHISITLRLSKIDSQSTWGHFVTTNF